MADLKGHTELPWAATTRKGNWDWVVYSANDPNIEIGQLFHDGSEFNEIGEANAKLIVTAVNTYPAVERLVKALEFYADMNNWTGGTILDMESSHFDGWSKAQSALSRFRSLQNGGVDI